MQWSNLTKRGLFFSIVSPEALILILEKSSTVDMKSSLVRYCFPAKCFFMLGNRQLSDDAKSGEHGGWLTGSKPLSRTTAISTRDRCAGALSWWSRTPFVSFQGRFDLIAFRTCLNKLTHYPPLIVWPLHPRRRRPSPFLPMAPPWPSLEGVMRGVFTAWNVVWSLVRSGGPNTHLGWGNIQENWLDLLKKVPSSSAHDQPCVLLSRRQKPWHPPSGNLRHAKFVVQMFLTCFWKIPTALAIWLTVKRLSWSITIWWTRSMLSWVVAVAGRANLESSSRLSLTLLNSAANFCTVDKSEASSPYVATM